MFAAAALLSLLATSALALPTKRAVTCPWNGVPTASEFTLLAVYDNDNTVRKAVALGTNGVPASPVSWLGTAESISSVVGTNFVLQDGGMTALPLAANGTASVSDPVAPANGLLSFIKPAEGATIPPESVYCELFNTSPHGTEFPFGLAVGGESDAFSVCSSTTSAQALVVFEATQGGAANDGFDFSTCQPVHVHIIFVDGQQ